MQNLKVNSKISYSRYSRSFFIILVLIAFVGCTNKTFNTEKELWEYLKNEENGYIQYKNINGYDFTLLYKPTDLLVQQELGDSITSKKIATLREKYNKYMYFNLSMSKNNQELLSTAPSNRNEFGAMVNQLAFGMGNKVHLYTRQKDTLELVDFIYPRLYGISKSTEILFIFDRNEQKDHSENLNFTIEDFGLFTGEVKFKISEGKIQNEPKLIF